VAHAFPHDPHDDKPKGDQGKGARLRHGGHFRNGDRRIEVRERARATETGGVAPEGRGGGAPGQLSSTVQLKTHPQL